MAFAPSGGAAGVDENSNLAERYAQEAQERILQQYRMPFEMQQGPQEDLNEEGDLDHVSLSLRGKPWTELLTCMSSPLLRLGLFIQLTVLSLGFALYYGHGGRRVFTFDIFSMPEPLRGSGTYSAVLIGLGSANLLGCLCLAGFQIYVADNSKMTRGFRAGSKLLSAAITLDLLVISLRLMQYIYAYEFLGTRWWLKYTQNSADWCLFHSGAILQSFALALYGLAFFYMETYHDEGTYEEWAWLIVFLYGLASLAEMSLALTGFGSFYTCLYLMALIASVIWAFSFEPLLHFYAPQLHDRDPNTDITLPTK